MVRTVVQLSDWDDNDFKLLSRNMDWLRIIKKINLLYFLQLVRLKAKLTKLLVSSQEIN